MEWCTLRSTQLLLLSLCSGITTGCALGYHLQYWGSNQKMARQILCNITSYENKWRYFVLFGGHSWKFSGLTPGHVLREHFLKGYRDHTEFLGLNSGWRDARILLSPLYYLLAQLGIIYLKIQDSSFY